MSEVPEKIESGGEEALLQKRKAILGSLKSNGQLPPHPLETEWKIDGDDVLSSIHRASDLSRRGVRGLIAEFFFETEVIPTALLEGWKVKQIPAGDWPYDSLLVRDGKTVSIQVKLQRLEKGIPKHFHALHYKQNFYDVEVQKTRTGQKRARKQESIRPAEAELNPLPLSATRPYPFGAFDILAVNMQPSTKRWGDFRFTVGTWLLERVDAPDLIEIHQPVSLEPNDAWTDNLNTCLQWFLGGEKRKVLQEIKHPRRFRRAGRSQS